MQQQPQQHQQQQQIQQWQQTTAVQPANVPYFINAVPVQTCVYPHFPKKTALGLGITLIIAGSLSIVFNSVSLAINLDGVGWVGHGFWTGVLSIIAGSLGIGAGVKKTKCLICSFNVMCVIAASCTAGQFAAGFFGAVSSGWFVQRDCNNYYYYYWCSSYKAQFAMTILLTIHAVIEAVAAIWGSAICCKTSCCCSCCETNPRPAVMQPVGVPMQMMSGIQPLPPMQSVVMVQGYPYQPQPMQLLNVQPQAMYQVQGQLPPPGQQPQYSMVPPNVMYMDQQLTVPAQPAASTASKAQAAPSYPFPPDYHQ